MQLFIKYLDNNKIPLWGLRPWWQRVILLIMAFKAGVVVFVSVLAALINQQG